jgi:hypothetical protein
VTSSRRLEQRIREDLAVNGNELKLVACLDDESSIIQCCYSGISSDGLPEFSFSWR